MTPEEEDRLYKEREKANQQGDDCPADEIKLPADIDPVTPAEDCDVDEINEADFLPPNLPPADPESPEDLPGPLVVSNPSVEATCVDGGDPDRILIGGAYNNPPDNDAFVVAADQPDLSQFVYLDDISVIPQEELFRLASYIVDIQIIVNENLEDAILASDLTVIDDAIASLTGTPQTIAVVIRQALVIAYEDAKAVAESLAAASIVCGYANKELWVVCDQSPQGYYITYSDPGGDPGDSAHVDAGVFTSQTSQEDANRQAAQSITVELSCLVTNTVPAIKSCSDLGGSVSETDTITWPTAYTFADPPTELEPAPVLSVEDQGIPSWDNAQWDAAENNTSSVALSLLNGLEFIQYADVGSEPDTRRVLRTTARVNVGDPRTAASSEEIANEIAENIALQELDCFFPSPPRSISCASETYGSVGPRGVRARALAVGGADSYDGRTEIYNEMLGGDPVADGGPEYNRLNVGIEDYDGAGETVDSSIAFEVRVWPGFFDATSAAAAEEAAGNYASGHLQCLWISPKHVCECQDSAEEPAPDEETFPDRTVKFPYLLAEKNTAKLDETKSKTDNETPRGIFQQEEYPHDDLALNSHNPDELWWDIVPPTCISGLSCFFYSCKVVYCEPKPDDRPYKINSMPNYATWGTNFLSRPATYQDQALFINEWKSRLATALTEDYVSASPQFCQEFGDGEWDKCLVHAPTLGHSAPATQLTDLGDDDVVHRGPINRLGTYGTPARFKYGGVLRWGASWGDPGTDEAGYTGPVPGDDDDPLQIDGDTLKTMGSVKQCSQVITTHVIDEESGVPELITEEEARWQTPHPWGFYSGAEGYAEDYTPIGLGDLAASIAIGRLDCTHLAWPRHLINCSQPGQRPFGAPAVIDIMTEGSSTREANEQVEAILLSMLECQDPGSFRITIDGFGKLSILGPSAVSASANDCGVGGGLLPITLLKDCDTPADVADADANESAHYFIEVMCCPEGEAKQYILHVVGDPALSYTEVRDAKQKGELGTQSGWDILSTMQSSGGEVWYIATLYVDAQTAPAGKSDPNADRIIVQAHTGPIVVADPCCDSYSSSESESSESESFESESSESESSKSESSGSSESEGPPPESSGSGSDKSTAIVQDPLGRYGVDFIAFYTMEMPEVRFEEQTICRITKNKSQLRYVMDAQYIKACESGTVAVVSALDQNGRHVRVTLEENGMVAVIHLKWWQRFLKRYRTTHVHLRLSAVRRAFLHKRLPKRSRKQYEENEATLKSAYSGYDED